MPVVCVLQVFYHLGELDQALTYALGAGSLFDITEQTEYVQTILCECERLVLTWLVCACNTCIIS